MRRIVLLLIMSLMLHPVSAYQINGSFTTLSGTSVSYGQYSGNYLFLEGFWTDCTVCVTFHETIKSLYEEYSGILSFASVAVFTTDSIRSVQEFVDAHGGSWTFGLDDGNLRTTLNIGSTPTSFLLDTDGKVLVRWDGNQPREDIANAIEYHVEENVGATVPDTYYQAPQDDPEPTPWWVIFITNPITQLTFIIIVVLLVYRKVR
ncbi:MAG: TlpA family protein disulfide reductase [Candidatus Heimdallarchaeota archaeon]|nr:TlpA family protein disulfide reductase [Candidatus Heimdallarchaeota archaeon]